MDSLAIQSMPLNFTRPDEPYLLTPGPLTTSLTTKQAMLCDWGSWDDDFRAMTRTLRSRLVAMLGPGDEAFDCVPMQGSGTFAVESMLGTFVPRDSKTLVLANGAYGQRSAETLRRMGRQFEILDKGDYLPPRGAEVAEILRAQPEIEQVVAIHCETSSGILNPLEEISQVVYAEGRKLLVDSMSAFGAVEFDLAKIRCEALVSSANKCIEGVPGFGFILARKSALEAAQGNSPSLSLDAEAQWSYMNKTGQWRFTPPTHAVAAFLTALDEHAAENGVAGRHSRYARNRDVLVEGMRAIGFETLLDERWLSPIIVTFFCPADPNFRFQQFYSLLKSAGFIIYPGKLTLVESFRVGCIGRIDAHVMQAVVRAAADALAAMGVQSAAPPAEALAERARLASQD